MNTRVPVTSTEETFYGVVKWFNNKTGIGFITLTRGERIGSDIFVHHSAIKVSSEQYKYLEQGEYVEMNLVKSTSGDHEFQASNVTGRDGGKLMCETRHEVRLTRNNYRDIKHGDQVNVNDEEDSEPVKIPRSVKPPSSGSAKVRGEGPRDSDGWTYSKRDRTEQIQPNESLKPRSTRGRGRPSNAK